MSAKKLPAERPAAEKPAAEKPAAEKPAAERPAAGKQLPAAKRLPVERGLRARAAAGSAGAPVVDRIKEYILRSRLAPGDPMPTENELSEQLGVSRSRVREAVKTLSALDIVEVRHGYGTYVGRLGLTAMVESLAFRGMLDAQDDQDVMADLIDVRQSIETGLAEVIVERSTPEVLTSMRELTAGMHEKASRGEEFAAEDREFHLLLMRTTGNALAVQLTGAFWDVHAIALGGLPGATDLARTAGVHVAVADAIAHGDSGLLRAAIVSHYAPVRERMGGRGGSGERRPTGGPVGDGTPSGGTPS